MGVERQAVNRSAGSSGFIGSSSFGPQAASWIQFLTGELLVGPVWAGNRWPFIVAIWLGYKEESLMWNTK